MLKFRWTVIQCPHLEHWHGIIWTQTDSASKLVQSTNLNGTPSKNHQIFPASGPPDSSAGSRWPEALSLLDTMQRADVQRDVVAWNACMSACENLGECLLSMDGEVSFFKVWWMGGFVPKWMEWIGKRMALLLTVLIIWVHWQWGLPLRRWLFFCQAWNRALFGRKQIPSKISIQLLYNIIHISKYMICNHLQYVCMYAV